MKEVYFIQRVAAYLVDMIIITLVSTLLISLVELAMPKNSQYTEAVDNYTKLSNEFLDKLTELSTKEEKKEEKKEETKETEDNDNLELTEEEPKEEQNNKTESTLVLLQEYVDSQKKNIYIIDKQSSLSSIFDIVLCIGYFGAFQFMNKGQTLGKKLCGIKVVSNNKKKYTYALYILRSVLNYGLISKILLIILFLFLNENNFIIPVGLVEMIAFLFNLTLIIMAAFVKNGRTLSDIICGTKVVSSK
jgi:uncharacterized RDD family membrane protein YckC